MVRITQARWLKIAAALAISAALAVPMAKAATHKKKHRPAPAASSKKAKRRKGKKIARRIAPPKAPPTITAAPGTLAALAQGYRLKPSAAKAATLESYARAHAGTPAEGQADLALAATEVQQGHFDAIPRLTAVAAKRLPELADYAAYFNASALRDAAAVDRALEPVWSAKPESPLSAPAAMMLARTLLDASKPQKALDVLDRHGPGDIPSVLLLRGRASEALNHVADAAHAYQAIYFDTPLASESADAERALARLRDEPGYPAAGEERILGRAQKLLDAGQHEAARRYLESSLPRLDGEWKDLAEVRIGAALFFAKDDSAAYDRLKSLNVDSPPADAERLFYVARSAGRMDREAEAHEALDALAKRHPDSVWRQRALIAEGNRHLVANERAAYEPLYRACYESFLESDDSAYCHWKVVWAEYLDGHSRAAAALKAHLQNYPHSAKANAAMYFLGRIAESSEDWDAAGTWYTAIADRFPNSYYAILARERLHAASIAGASESPDVRAFVNKLPRPSRPQFTGFDPLPSTAKRILRARLLTEAGLDDEADRELRFGAETDGQPQIDAYELASLASQRGAPDKGIRYIKHYVAGYLNLPLDAAPIQFWQLAFPLPYRRPLEQYSLQHSLDPYLTAALIRQESEFNSRAVSIPGALGLTQVMPATGRQISHRVGIARFRTALLFQPEVNLRIGTYYLRALLDGLQGSPEAALASYNAGKSRVDAWLAWTTYKEPAEFVESIPFTQTRDYVEVVLHNADIYRRLYGHPAAAVARIITPKS